MGQGVVEHGVLLRQRFAVHHVAVLQPFQQPVRMRAGPGLDEAELPFAAAADQIVAAGLQQQFSGGAEADAGVGAVQLFFYDQRLAGKLAVGHVAMAFVPVLQARAFQVGGAGVSEQVQRLRVGAEIERHESSPGYGEADDAVLRGGKRGGCVALPGTALAQRCVLKTKRRAVKGEQADRDTRTVLVGV
ncbi:hypothetical protein D3C85_1256050 [compost metagenome]